MALVLHYQTKYYWPRRHRSGRFQ